MKRYSGRFKHTLELVGGKRAASVALFLHPESRPSQQFPGIPGRDQTQDARRTQSQDALLELRGPGPRDTRTYTVARRKTQDEC